MEKRRYAIDDQWRDEEYPFPDMHELRPVDGFPWALEAYESNGRYRVCARKMHPIEIEFAKSLYVHGEYEAALLAIWPAVPERFITNYVHRFRNRRVKRLMAFFDEFAMMGHRTSGECAPQAPFSAIEAYDAVLRKWRQEALPSGDPKVFLALLDKLMEFQDSGYGVETRTPSEGADALLEAMSRESSNG